MSSMSKLALMYACGDCFSHKKKQDIEQRTYTGNSTSSLEKGHQQNKNNGAGRNRNATKHQDVSVHGTDPEHAEDNGEGLLFVGCCCTLADMGPALSLAKPDFVLVAWGAFLALHTRLFLDGMQTHISPLTWPGRSESTKLAGTTS